MTYDIYPLRNSRIVRYNSGIGGQSRIPTLRRDNSGIVPILTLRRTYTPVNLSLTILKMCFLGGGGGALITLACQHAVENMGDDMNES